MNLIIKPVLSITIVENEMFFKNSAEVFDLFQVLTASAYFGRFTLNKLNSNKFSQTNDIESMISSRIVAVTLVASSCCSRVPDPSIIEALSMQSDSIKINSIKFNYLNSFSHSMQHFGY